MIKAWASGAMEKDSGHSIENESDQGRRLLTREETIAAFIQAFKRGLSEEVVDSSSGEVSALEDSTVNLVEYCKAEHVEEAKAIMAKKLRDTFDTIMEEMARKTSLNAEELKILKGMLLETMGRMLEY
jgi:hypothetical protein